MRLLYFIPHKTKKTQVIWKNFSKLFNIELFGSNPLKQQQQYTFVIP